MSVKDLTLASKKITTLIMNTRSIHEIQIISTEHSGHFNSYNLGAFFNQCGQIVSAQKNKAEILKARLLLMRLSNLVTSQISDFNTSSLSNLLSGMNPLGLKDPVLLPAIIERCKLKIKSFGSKHLVNLAICMANLNILDQNLIAALADEVIKKISLFSTRDCCGMLWALPILNCENTRTFEVLVEKINATNPGSFNHNDLTQLIPLNIILMNNHKPCLREIIFSSTVSNLIQQHALNHSDKTISYFHKQVSFQLKEMGIKHTLEKNVSGIMMDIALDQSPVDIECDGNNFHYLSDGSLYGSYRLRDDILLKSLHWSTQRIKQSDWDKSRNQKRLLKKTIEKGTSALKSTLYKSSSRD